MRYLILSLALMLSACGPQVKDQDPRSISGVNPAFKPYVDMFESMYGKSIGDVPIQFQELSGNTIGVCTRWSNGYRQIQIDPSYWNDSYTDDRAKIGLIFHELGHCVLNRDHVEDREYYSGSHIAGEIPVSLMYPYNFFSNWYSELDSYYFSELFHPQSTTLTSSSLASTKAHDCVVDVEQ